MCASPPSSTATQPLPQAPHTHNGNVGHKSPIHDVHVDPVCPGLVNGLHLRKDSQPSTSPHEQMPACL